MAAARIDGRLGGRIDMITGPARFHWRGTITTWEPCSVLEYTFDADPHQFLPDGERSVVRYELQPVDGGTRLFLRHTRLTRATALGFAPGTHALLDRLAARLDGEPLPGWQKRYDEVRGGYLQGGAARRSEQAAG